MIKMEEKAYFLMQKWFTRINAINLHLYFFSAEKNSMEKNQSH